MVIIFELSFLRVNMGRFIESRSNPQGRVALSHNQTCQIRISAQLAFYSFPLTGGFSAC
jgi:hypothetical protein